MCVVLNVSKGFIKKKFWVNGNHIIKPVIGLLNFVKKFLQGF